jgi:hypothetical protein
MAELKLGVIKYDEPAKLTVELPADLHLRFAGLCGVAGPRNGAKRY